MGLSAIEKAANKAAQSVRDRAYRRRRKAYQDARDAVDNDPEVKNAHEIFNALDAKALATLNQRNRRIDELRAEIAELEQTIKMLQSKSSVDSEFIERSKAAETWRTLKEKKLSQVEQAFPDMQSRSSVAVWEAPPDVLAEMEAARRAVLSGKTTQSEEEGEEENESEA